MGFRPCPLAQPSCFLSGLAHHLRRWKCRNYSYRSQLADLIGCNNLQQHLTGRHYDARLEQKGWSNLARKVEENGFHLDVGVLGTKAILNALSENGYAETAYKVAVQDTYPSWGWWVVNGATTLLENRDLQATRDISDNHMMFGEIGAWFYKGLGGIFPDPAQPGFRNILLRPHFMKGLKRFEARHQSPYGEIISRWEWEGKRVHYEVTVPANSTATLTLPDKDNNERVMELKAGTYEFIVK